MKYDIQMSYYLCYDGEKWEDCVMNVHNFWKAVLQQDEQEIRKYFHEDAYVNWHCTNEHLTQPAERGYRNE